jgi:hypothetical protein
MKSETSESFDVTDDSSNPIDMRPPQEKLSDVESKLSEGAADDDEKFTLLVQKRTLSRMIFGETSPEAICATTRCVRQRETWFRLSKLLEGESGRKADRTSGRGLVRTRRRDSEFHMAQDGENEVDCARRRRVVKFRRPRVRECLSRLPPRSLPWTDQLIPDTMGGVLGVLRKGNRSLDSGPPRRRAADKVTRRGEYLRRGRARRREGPGK